MVTDELIKKEFIHSIVTRDINRIYETQEEVIRANFKGGTGRLAEFLSQHPVSMSGEGLKQTYHMRVFSYLRFLDIRYRKQEMFFRRRLALYNRVIWGILYNETMQDLRYGLTDNIRELMRNDLEQFGGVSSLELRNSWANHLL